MRKVRSLQLSAGCRVEAEAGRAKWVLEQSRAALRACRAKSRWLPAEPRRGSGRAPPPETPPHAPPLAVCHPDCSSVSPSVACSTFRSFDRASVCRPSALPSVLFFE